MDRSVREKAVQEMSPNHTWKPEPKTGNPTHEPRTFNDDKKPVIIAVIMGLADIDCPVSNRQIQEMKS